MSSWLDRQRQEAFEVYRTYLALSLHFREGSAYDYARYNGGTKVTLEGFNKKPNAEILKFIALKNKLKQDNISPEEFLLANARKDDLSIHNLNGWTPFNNYDEWKIKFGTYEAYLATSRTIFKDYWIDIKSPWAFAIHLLDSYFKDRNPDLLEAVAYIIHFQQPVYQEYIQKEAGQNAILKIAYDKAQKLRSVYSNLGIL